MFIGSLVDLFQFSWIIKRSLSSFKHAYKKKLLKELQTEGLLEDPKENPFIFDSFSEKSPGKTSSFK